MLLFVLFFFISTFSASIILKQVVVAFFFRQREKNPFLFTIVMGQFLFRYVFSLSNLHQIYLYSVKGEFAKEF